MSTERREQPGAWSVEQVLTMDVKDARKTRELLGFMRMADDATKIALGNAFVERSAQNDEMRAEAA
ncbi:MAG: hypothetical protein US42_C0002G0079 [Candidatus Magasanikbacteria bacterium GW2011_GWC2_37_14]|uniref:Uncharacterized protein n=1 Tax=Candidatus Magasanikbacteria bacterium GW2011_GWC2_37_14 TaxID=1619046 RepID=A0A0G0IVG8_9BACT|nr:MAG: hypothetical protein US42_C0002G0079 [Candidatus Magasanikbacteria bacterium GW2011_GWC2_37_14]